MSVGPTRSEGRGGKLYLLASQAAKWQCLGIGNSNRQVMAHLGNKQRARMAINCCYIFIIFSRGRGLNWNDLLQHLKSVKVSCGRHGYAFVLRTDKIESTFALGIHVVLVLSELYHQIFIFGGAG